MRLHHALTTGCAIALVATTALNPTLAFEPAPIRIGVLPTMLRGGANPGAAAAIKEPLLNEVEAQTGFDCKIVPMLTLNHMRRQLSSGKLHFGLCQGYEFAWMRLKQPELKALMIAAPVHKSLRVFVIVVESSSAKTVCDLKGKTVAMPKGSHPTVKLFADRYCRCDDKEPSQYVKELTRPENAEVALQELFDNKIQAAIVDSAAMQCFAERFPAQFKMIRTIAESDPFPMSVIITRDGAVAPDVIRAFQEGMEKANSSPRGRQLMSLIHSAGFEPLPPDFDKQLAEFVKRYPPTVEEVKDDEPAAGQIRK